MSAARWIRRYAVRIVLIVLAVDTVGTIGSCVYLAFSNLGDTVTIPLAGDFLAGGAGVLAVVGTVVAVATYATGIAPPKLGAKVRIGTSHFVALNTAGTVLEIPCSPVQNGLRALTRDLLLDNLDLAIVVSNDSDYTASNISCRVSFKGVTAVPRTQSDWSFVAPDPEWDRAYLWEGTDRTVLTRSTRPLPVIALAGASLSGNRGTIGFSLQAERSDPIELKLELRAS